MKLSDLVQHLIPRKNRIRRLRRMGDAAMSAGRWTDAAVWYGKVLALEPIPAIKIQYAHALRESGDFGLAIEIYASVTGSIDEENDARFHHAITMIDSGQQDRAVDLLVEVLAHDDNHRDAYNKLIQLGGRNRLPDNFHRDKTVESIFKVEQELRVLRAELDRLSEVSTFPLPAYDSFRRSYPIIPPPRVGLPPTIAVMVDARDVGAAFLRSTLISLIDQTTIAWTAQVRTHAGIAQHSVSSLAHADPRITVSESVEDPYPIGRVLCISAGTILDPNAIAWVAFTFHRSDCTALWCDTDCAAVDLGGTMRYWGPRLWGVFDADIIAQTSTPPALVVINTDHVDFPNIDVEPAPEWRRTALLAASKKGAVAHVPRILATVTRLPDRAISAPADGQIALWSEDPSGAPPRLGAIAGHEITIIDRPGRSRVSVGLDCDGGKGLQVIIQTRGGGSMLKRAIESILNNAIRPDRIEITIVDNRSTDSDTLDYLNMLRKSSIASIIVLDEPFNWARANNLAAMHSISEIVVFVNDDIEMLTSGWDDVVVSLLQRKDVGAVGVRMLYPDGSIQHGGVLFGIGDGGPIHDGARHSSSDAGPIQRLELTRTVPAVTGAFLGVCRTTFTEIEGFDAKHFSIGYNDIDFCMRVRESGKTILYTPAIELIHHESATRGLNVSRSRVAWDIGEMHSLFSRWNGETLRDPGYNPQWSKARPFDGFKNPTTTEVLEWIDRSCSPEPWRTRRHHE